MKSTIATFVLAAVTLCLLAPNPAFADDQKNIQGTWTLQTASVNGKVMPGVSAVYVFNANTLTIRSASGKEDKATFTLETASKPKVLVVSREQHSPDAKPDRTPYELDGDSLRISFPAPDEHTLQVSDDGQMLFTLKRASP